MLTQEQIQNLKPGDPVFVRGKFKSVDDDGDFWIETGNCYRCYDPLCVSLPSEIVNRQSSTVNKHDPTRLFKKGDKVRIVKYNGRKFDAAPPTFQLGKVYRVDEDEDTEHCYVMLQSCDLYYAHPVAFLELVTPVEEIEPYKLIDSPNTYNIVRDSAMVMTIHKKSHPNAKEAAEAECDRLNAEWRKEQK